MPLKSMLKCIVLIGGLFVIVNCHAKDRIITMIGKTMGTTYHIKVIPNNNFPDKVTLNNQIDAALEDVNSQMSTYRPKSELSRFNKVTSNKNFSISPEMEHVISAGIDLFKKTSGALDITVGPLVNLWGFGPDKRPSIIPTKTIITAVKKNTGIKFLHLQKKSISKSNPNLYVDLSSIAKGYGVDKVAELLNKYQPQGYMVEIGGEVKVFGTKTNGKQWHIAIEKPSGNGDVQLIIAPKNIAMATSGNYRNFYQKDGKRFTHIIDPRTGYPVQHNLASVTVMNASSMIADGYATAMMVLGTKASLELAEKKHLAIMLIDRGPHGYLTFYSSSFKKIKPIIATKNNV